MPSLSLSMTAVEIYKHHCRDLFRWCCKPVCAGHTTAAVDGTQQVCLVGIDGFLLEGRSKVPTLSSVRYALASSTECGPRPTNGAGYLDGVRKHGVVGGKQEFLVFLRKMLICRCRLHMQRDDPAREAGLVHPSACLGGYHSGKEMPKRPTWSLSAGIINRPLITEASEAFDQGKTDVQWTRVQLATSERR